MVENLASRLRPEGRELVDLLDSAGRVLAEPIAADRNFPPFPRATRDGFALRAADVQQVPVSLKVVGEIKAGASQEESSLHVAAGEAVSIMTGAPAPAGADAVVMVEHTSRHGGMVEVQRSVTADENIVPPGAEAKRGERLLASGLRLDHAAIAVAASVGRAHLLVCSNPRVAVLSTGDEIVDIDVPPGPNQIRNSNSYSLAAQIKRAGGEPILLPIAPDESVRLRELMTDGLDADLLLLTGGVSMGKYDLVEQVLREFNAEFFFTGALIQPGRPIVVGRIPAAQPDARALHFLGLPGNPVSTMVTFELFARPLVEALAGMLPRKLVFPRARLKTEIRIKTGLTRFLPALLSGEFADATVELTGWQGSGDIASAARSNCYAVIPPDRERIPEGEWIPVLMK